MTLAREALDGSRLSLAKILTQVENGTSLGKASLQELFPYTGKAHIIGVTGAPGTGKSTLVNALAKDIRSPQNGEMHKVAILAVDPSSPFTGGAILGDRVRMKDLAGDRGIFIRSMATRGSLGGLAAAATSMTQVFDAAGYDRIIIETVGAGQAEVDIATLAHTVIVVEAPGFGDDIQAIKAGILEIADILVINKSDLPGVEATERALKTNLNLLSHSTTRIINPDFIVPVPEPLVQPGYRIWVPPVLKTVATNGAGISAVIQAIDDHKKHLTTHGRWEEKETSRLLVELKHILMFKLYLRWKESIPADVMNHIVQEVLDHSKSPDLAVEELIQEGE